MLTTTPAKRADQPASPPLIKAARLSAEVFIDHFCWIRPREGGQPEPFQLWDFQREVLADIERNARLIVLKARQLGLSWLTLAYILWLVTCNHGQTALVYNRGQRESKELLARVKFMWARLPDTLRPRATGDSEKLEFPDLDSRVISLPASEDAGSTYTANFVLLDEWAKMAYATSILNAALGTLSAGGTLVGISTAKGYHNLFARTWRGALAGANEYWPLFIPSSAHPARDDAWRATKRREYDTERDYLQEHPEEWQDAFQLLADSVFGKDFDRQKHTTTVDRDPESQWPVWRGVDFGYHHSPAYWLEVQAERIVVVFDELAMERSTTEELAGAITAHDRDLALKTSDVLAGVDPAGKAQTSASSYSDIATLERHGIRVAYQDPKQGELRQVLPKDRVGLIKRLLREGRLIIHADRCPRLVEALEQAQWKKIGPGDEAVLQETYAKDGVYEHPLDALGYALINIFPTAGAPAGAAAGTSRAAEDPYSESDFG